LDLPSNPIYPIGAEHISNALLHIPHLTTLRLSYPFLGAIGIEHISNGLLHVPHLTTLELDWAVGAQHIANALHHVRHLTVLKLECCDIGDTGADYISKGLYSMFQI